MGRTRGRAASLLLLLLFPSCSREEAAGPGPPPLPEAGPEPWEVERDPVRARTMKLETEWRLDPAFVGMDLRFFDHRPALVAVEGTGDPAEGEALRGLEGAVRGLLREAGLAAPTLAEMGDERIRLMVFRDRASFERWHARNRLSTQRNPYYRRSDRMILAWPGGPGMPGCLELGTFALRHVYSRLLCEADDAEHAKRAGEPPPRVEWDDHRLLSSFAWFDRGLAHRFGASPAAREADLAFFRKALEERALWPLEEILFADANQVQARALVKGEADPRIADTLEAVAAVQGHFLVRYLMEGEGGRWRPGFLRLLRNEFQGISGRVYLLEAFGLVDGKGRALRERDPKVTAWIREVEAGSLRFVEGLK